MNTINLFEIYFRMSNGDEVKTGIFFNNFGSASKFIVKNNKKLNGQLVYFYKEINLNYYSTFEEFESENKTAVKQLEK